MDEEELNISSVNKNKEESKVSIKVETNAKENGTLFMNSSLTQLVTTSPSQSRSPLTPSINKYLSSSNQESNLKTVHHDQIELQGLENIVMDSYSDNQLLINIPAKHSNTLPPISRKPKHNVQKDQLSTSTVTMDQSSTSTVTMDQSNLWNDNILTTTFIDQETSLHLPPPVSPKQKQYSYDIQKVQLPNVVFRLDQSVLNKETFCNTTFLDDVDKNQTSLHQTKPVSSNEENKSFTSKNETKSSSADIVKKAAFERKSKAFEVVHPSTTYAMDEVKILIPSKKRAPREIPNELTTPEMLLTHQIEMKHCGSTKTETMSNQGTLNKIGQKYQNDIPARIKVSIVTPVGNQLDDINNSCDANESQKSRLPHSTDDTTLLICLILSLEADYPATFFDRLCASESFVTAVKNHLSKDSLKLLTRMY